MPLNLDRDERASKRARNNQRIHMCAENEEERRDKATDESKKKDAKTTTATVTTPNEFMNMRLSGLWSPVWQARLHPCPLPHPRWREYATGCHGNNGRKW